MFWDICCCRRDKNVKTEENTNSNSMNESQNTQISVINVNGTVENGSNSPYRERTGTESSVSSMHSIKSYYSVKSTMSRDGDFYSICSEESFKST